MDRVLRPFALLALAASALFWAARIQDSTFTSAASSTGESYSFLAANAAGPATWPCQQTIDVVVNDEILDPATRDIFRADLDAAIAAIAEASPFRFRVVGSTSAIPTRQWGSKFATYHPAAPVVVAVAPSSTSDLSKEHGAAAGGSFFREAANGRLISFAGYVLVGFEHFFSYRQGSGPGSHQALLTHELLHVLNLAHAEGPHSVLTERLSESAGFIGPVDVAGLTHLARHACS